jgi:carbonic anhydrase
MTNPGPDDSKVTRRGFFGAAGGTSLLAAGMATGGLASAAAAGTVLAGSGVASASPAPEVAGAVNPHATLDHLLTGNKRWAAGTARHPNQSVQRRHELATHQEPPAVVVSCIDSRVPPELVFDVGLGEMFVIRTGAQTLDEGVVLGSIEFGPAKFPAARLILVLGHSGCGAVSAAITLIRDGGQAPGHIQAVVDALRPAYHVAVRETGDLLNNMIRAQTRLTVERLKRDPVLKEIIDRDGLLIVGGHYQLESGLVAIIA